jgi:hypothetical protein
MSDQVCSGEGWQPKLLAKRISTIKVYSLQVSTFALPAFSLSISQETKISSFRSFHSYLTLHPIWTAFLVFDRGFVFVSRSHLHLSFSLTMFAAFYFMDEPSIQCCQISKHFVCLAFCSTLNPLQSNLFLMFTSFNT